MGTYTNKISNNVTLHTVASIAFLVGKLSMQGCFCVDKWFILIVKGQIQGLTLLSRIKVFSIYFSNK